MKYPTSLSDAIALCLLLCSLCSTGVTQANDVPDTASQALRAAVLNSTDRIIVRYRHAVTGTADITALSQRISQITGYSMIPIGHTYNGAQILKLKLEQPLDALHGIIAAIEENAEVEYAEPDIRVLPLYTPNDPRYDEQWHYFEATGGIGLPKAWDHTQGESSVVAVIDSGYLPHEDLLPNLLPGYDMISDLESANDGDGRDDDPLDPGDYDPDCGITLSTWHGTHVAGTIAAVGNNGIGVTGVAFQAKILPVRVLGKCGGYLSDVADAIVWASGTVVTDLPLNQTPANVINMSLSGSVTLCPKFLQQAIDTARQQGTTIAVAAGNGGQESSGTTPANCDGVVSVAATTRMGALASFSNYGERVDLAAPGEQILSTYNDGAITPGRDSYAKLSGTSMSTPHVSGVLAMLYAVKPGITPDEAEQILKQSARPFPSPCAGCGAGILDASKAVERASENPPPDEPTLIMLKNGVAETGLEGSQETLLMFAIDLPADATSLSVLMSGGSGDADLYVRYAAAPTLSSYYCRPYLYGNTEICRMQSVQAGRYYVMLHGYSAYAGTSLVAAYATQSNAPKPGASFANQQDYPIPNFRFSGVSSPITVTREWDSGKIDIAIEIKHPYIQEISVELLDPQGHSHSLKAFGGEAVADLSEIYSLDLGALPSAGTWALRVRDFGYRGSGYIDSWRITFR
jgi:serine protease